MSSDNHVNIILDLYKIYDGHRDSRLWFLDELDANNYKEYHEKYSADSKEKSHFIAVCGFFELFGTLISHGLINPDIYFDIFNPSPFWHKAKPIIQGMRETRPRIYENFEAVSEKRNNWKKKRHEM
ncbi:MAG: DUF4760 domain-containing protein [Candidatus Nitrosocosmicus sp.]|nr:DUF4760 domain-containing protein [Candidatus Nitrosocosmicus sp.]MDN5866293.1 DUF4760 domain-containing protein [Candidatus Nitrosocosmicus sp.]